MDVEFPVGAGDHDKGMVVFVVFPDVHLVLVVGAGAHLQLVADIEIADVTLAAKLQGRGFGDGSLAEFAQEVLGDERPAWDEFRAATVNIVLPVLENDMLRGKRGLLFEKVWELDIDDLFEQGVIWQ